MEEITKLKEIIVNLTIENSNIKNEIITYKNEIELLKEKLKKYSNPERSKKYYENHKDELKEKYKKYQEEYRTKIDPDKKAEYNKRAYQKKKEKELLTNLTE